MVTIKKRNDAAADETNFVTMQMTIPMMTMMIMSNSCFIITMILMMIMMMIHDAPACSQRKTRTTGRSPMALCKRKNTLHEVHAASCGGHIDTISGICDQATVVRKSDADITDVLDVHPQASPTVDVHNGL